MSRYLIFAVISLSLLLVAISGSAISVAFPVITSSFNASLIMAGWVLSVFQLVATASMPLAGKAGEIFGAKLTFMVSLALFTVGSLLCAVAPNIQLLIVARFVQGIGSGSFLPMAAGIVADEFPRARQQAIGLFTSIFPIGQIIGPNLGAWMTDAFGWRSIFWFNIPLGVIAFIASALLLRAGKKEKGSMDLVGIGLFTGAMFSFMVGLSELGNHQAESSWLFAGLLFVAAVILLIAFLRYESKISNPVIDLQLIRERPFMAANIYNVVLGACIFGIMSFVPLYAVSIYGMSTLGSGLIMTPRSIGMMVASTVTSVFLVRWGYRWPILIGTAMMALSLILLAIRPASINLLGFQLSSVALLGGIMLLSGIGMGVAAPAANNACIELMPHRVAMITGVRGMFRQSGGTISIAVTTLLLENFSDMAQGFTVVFMGLAIIMLVTAPYIFVMPRGPDVAPLAED